MEIINKLKGRTQSLIQNYDENLFLSLDQLLEELRKIFGDSKSIGEKRLFEKWSVTCVFSGQNDFGKTSWITEDWVARIFDRGFERLNADSWSKDVPVW